MAHQPPGIVAGGQDDCAQPEAFRWQHGHVDAPRDRVELPGQNVFLKELLTYFSVVAVPYQFHVFRAAQLSMHLPQWLRAVDSTLQQCGVVWREHHKAVLQRRYRPHIFFVTLVASPQPHRAGGDVLAFALQLAAGACHTAMLLPWATYCVGHHMRSVFYAHSQAVWL